MNISLAFTTYNSVLFIENQLDKGYINASNGLIDEIVIQDDFTQDYVDLQKYKSDEVKLFQNKKHLSPLLSRVNLVNNCKNDWVWIMDSDNFLNVEIFDVIKNIELKNNTIYHSSFAKPNFSFKDHSNQIIDMKYAVDNFDALSTKILLNTGNYLAPKSEYLKVGEKIDTKYNYYTPEVLYYNYLWLSSGNLIHVLDEYEYEHTVRFGYWHNSNNIESTINEMYTTHYDNI